MPTGTRKRRLQQQLITTILFVCLSQYSQAQKDMIDFSDFGKFSQEEIDYKECPFDKDAEAVIFYDKAVSNYDGYQRLITTRSTRFKILNDKGISRGDIHIGYYSGDDFEKLYDIEATILNIDEKGNRIVSKINSKSIYINHPEPYYSIASFSMPNVHAGSIIEYKYTSICRHYGGMRDWELQHDIPTLTSMYKLYMLPGIRFDYSVYKNRFMNLETIKDSSSGSLYFKMSDIPGLYDEAYNTNQDDFLQRITFQQAIYPSYFGRKIINDSWEDINSRLLDAENFGFTWSKKLSQTIDINTTSQNITNQTDRMKYLFDYVKNNFKWDQTDSKFCDDGLKALIKKKSGNSGDLNLLLIHLLKENGLNTLPLLVRNKNLGKVDTSYHYLGQFKKVLALVKIDNKRYILDATDKETPLGLIPEDYLNTSAFIVDKESAGFIYLIENDKKYKEAVNLLAKIDVNGNMSGSSVIYNFDYAALSKTNDYSDNIQKYLNYYYKTYPDIHLDSFKLSNYQKDSLPLIEQCTFSKPVVRSGDYYLLNYDMFTGFDKNPFTKAHRFTDIDFEFQRSLTFNGFFTIPANMMIESLPNNAVFRTPDNSIVFSRIIEKKTQNIRILLKVEILKTYFLPDEYESLRNFYKQLFESIKEPVVLKMQ